MRRLVGLWVVVGSSRALSSVPAAARRLRELRRLEGEHARLVAGNDVASARSVRKELNALKRSGPFPANSGV